MAQIRQMRFRKCIPKLSEAAQLVFPWSSCGNCATSSAKNDAMNDSGKKMMVTIVKSMSVEPCLADCCAPSLAEWASHRLACFCLRSSMRFSALSTVFASLSIFPKSELLASSILLASMQGLEPPSQVLKESSSSEVMTLSCCSSTLKIILISSRISLISTSREISLSVSSKLLRSFVFSFS